MPIKIPNNLPAAEILQKENIFVMTETRATTQHIRPLRILLLNLMPKKVETETQLTRLLGNTPLQIELDLLRVTAHHSLNTSQEHLLSFYKTFDQVKETYYDGMIITGAPVEHLPFEEVDYWQELCMIMEWTLTHVHSTLHICWGAQAGLYYHYGIQKQPLEKKLFGVFPHRSEYRESMLTRGFDDVFMFPHSRHTTVKRQDIEANPGLQILISSDEAGVFVVRNRQCRQFFMMGHPEYDPRTLEAEYLRDVNAGKPIEPPVNYYPDDDPSQPPMVTWRGHANLLYSNWLNYFVYQTTPYDVTRVGKEACDR
ncbi:MAG: homoserine O-succinyltransferase [Clostridia bacterium]|nr:homoserine O-succinyltransferase [Clostridia bacterium]